MNWVPQDLLRKPCCESVRVSCSEMTNDSTVDDVFTHLTEDGGEGDWAIA